MSISDWKTEIVIAWRVLERLQEVDHAGIYEYRLPRVAATGGQLAATEQALGHPIDPEYRDFLTYANGWPDFLQSVDLFGTNDLQGGPLTKRALEGIAATDGAIWKELNIEPSAVLPIAMAKTNMDLFVIVRPGSQRAGQVIWLAGSVVERFPRFCEFFLAMVDYNRLRLERIMNSASGVSDSH